MLKEDKLKIGEILEHFKKHRLKLFLDRFVLCQYHEGPLSLFFRILSIFYMILLVSMSPIFQFMVDRFHMAAPIQHDISLNL